MQDKDPRREVEEATRIFLQPLASPLPLAFFAFGSGSALQSAQQLGLIPQSETAILGLVLGAFVFPPMALAGLFAFLTRETLGGTLIGLLAFSWLAQALVYYASAPAPINTLGYLSLILAILLITMGVTAFLGKPILAAFVTLAAVRYILTGVFELTMNTGPQTASAILGLVIFALTLYGGLAFGLEDVQHRTVLPIGRRGEAAEALEGDLSQQVGPVEQEAGVRKQL